MDIELHGLVPTEPPADQREETIELVVDVQSQTPSADPLQLSQGQRETSVDRNYLEFPKMLGWN